MLRRRFFLASNGGRDRKAARSMEGVVALIDAPAEKISGNTLVG
jgi:hypothetical protein